MPKNAENIRNVLKDMMAQVGLGPGVFESGVIFTTDCAAVEKKALENCRIDCAAHRCNTVLETGWKNTEACLPQALEVKKSCTELVGYVKRLGLNRELPCSLKGELKTRWNTHYFMFDSIAKSYETLYGKFKNSQPQLLRLAKVDRNVCAELAEFLENFKIASERLEADKTPTLQLVAVFYVRKYTEYSSISRIILVKVNSMFYSTRLKCCVKLMRVIPKF